MALSPWLSSIASWKKPSSSRFKASPIVHTAPEKENSRHKRSRKLSLDRLQRPTLNLHTTERNHYTGPHSAAKVDHFFAASDTGTTRTSPATSLLAIRQAWIRSINFCLEVNIPTFGVQFF